MPYEDEEAPLRRIRPRQRIGLSAQEIRDRESGRFLFSFGFPGSGKTTFQWMMMNYLMNEGPFRTEIQIPDRDGGPDWEGREIINSWKSQWIEGRFPDPTKATEGDIREVEIKARTTSGKKLDVDFSFLEVSGELLKQVKPSGGIATMSELLEAFFENPRFRFVVILMLNPDVEENDQLFASFLDYLKRFYPDVIDRMSLGVVVTKPETSLQRLREYGAADGSTGFAKLDDDALMAYLNRFCGETYQNWLDWPDEKRTLLAKLNLGTIEEIQGEMRLIEPDFGDIEEIFLWIFEQFAKKRPGPTLLQKLSGNLNWK